MQDISTLALGAGAGEPRQPAVNCAVRKLFLVMQGSYGSLFLSKFATGVLDEGGRDLGMRAAMRVWNAALGKYDDAVIELAVARLTDAHPDFPPNLPQFEALCRAAMPRAAQARLSAPAVRPIAVQLALLGDGKDWARRIVARAGAGDRSITRAVLRAAMQALGMQGWPR